MLVLHSKAMLYCFQACRCYLLPEALLGHRCFDGERNVGDGMLKREPPGMERDAAVGVAAWCAVLQVALDGAAYLGELAAYLVVTASMKRHLEEEVAVALCHEAIVEHRLLAVRNLTVVGSGCVLLLVAREPMRERAFWLRRPGSDDGKVGLPDGLMLGKHLIEPGQSLTRLGKQHNAADWTVEPVNHTKIDVPWLLIPVLQVILHHIRQGDIASLVSLHDVPCLLSDGNQVVVLVEYFTI